MGGVSFMDSGAIILLLAIIVFIICHPMTQMCIKHIRTKFRNPKKKVEKVRCYHTVGDCRDCISSSKCPMKHENVIVPKRTDYD